jgi:hypothetical protein
MAQVNHSKILITALESGDRKTHGKESAIKGCAQGF